VRQRSLLIVEDDVALIDYLSELFRLEGYRVRTALDGLQALELLEAGYSPDLMLLDMHLAGVDGWGVGAELQTMGLRVPIVVMTADPEPERCAAQVGARAWVRKPFMPRDLLAEVERQLSANCAA
jgi:CheY-like chemotaxis protein